MENYNNGSTEFEKARLFLEIGCNCGCSKMIPRDNFAELREAFQALSRSEQDIFLMAQLKAMDAGEILPVDVLKRKRVLISERFITEIVIRHFVRKRISIFWELVALTSKTSEII